MAQMIPVSSSPSSFATLTAQDIDHILRVIQVILKEEKRYCAIPNYGETVQKNKCMSVWRLQLITWLMEVAVEFGFEKNTAVVAINYLDRILSKAVIPAAQLQVAALSCMCLASKQHERHPISSKDLDIFVNICTPKDLRIAEQNTLFTLQWDANCCTPLTFMDLLLTLVSDNNIIRMLRKTAEEFFDIALSDYNLIGYTPSRVGLACLINSCLIQNFDIKPLLDGLMNSDIFIDMDESLSTVIMNGYRAQLLKSGTPTTAVGNTPRSTTATYRNDSATPASTITSYSSPRSLNTYTPSSIVSSTENSQDGFDVYPVSHNPMMLSSSSSSSSSSVLQSTNFSSIANHPHNNSSVRNPFRSSAHTHPPSHILSPIRDDMMDTDNDLPSSTMHVSNHQPQSQSSSLVTNSLGHDFGNRSMDLSAMSIPHQWHGTSGASNGQVFPSLLSKNSTTNSTIFSDDDFMIRNTATVTNDDNDCLTTNPNPFYNKNEFYCNENNYRLDMIDDIHAFSVSVTAELLGNTDDDDTLDISHGTDSVFPDDSSSSRMELSIMTDKLHSGRSVTENHYHHQQQDVRSTNNAKSSTESKNKKNYSASGTGNFPTSVTAFQKEYGNRHY